LKVRAKSTQFNNGLALRYVIVGILADSDWGDKMIQCKDCEFCEIGPDGRRSFKCDPFLNIKEPECIAKWQLIRLDMLVATGN